jgi:3-deoxy-D-manno-octulosonate 8-phosphate phosphatase (KDO 8-P phosphatase)
MNSSISLKLLESPSIQEKLRKIKLLALDVDGVMTNGRVFWIKGQGWTRHFHVHDGHGIRILMRHGIDVAVISAGSAEDVRARIEFLNIPHAFLGDEDKLKALEKLIGSTGLLPEQIGFIGDDLFDLPVLERVGFSASVPNAVDEVKKRVHYVTETSGGFGAIREIIDAILKAQGFGSP